MQVLNKSIARQANRGDNCTGRFWEGCFKSQALLDDAAILACMAYVDLNPIRVGMAETPEQSDFTSIQERLRQFAASRQMETPTEQPFDLLPFIGGEHTDAPKGIAFTLPDYLQLVDWTGRAVRDDKRGAIPAHIQPIFQRNGPQSRGMAGDRPELRPALPPRRRGGGSAPGLQPATGALLAPGRRGQPSILPGTCPRQ